MFAFLVLDGLDLVLGGLAAAVDGVFGDEEGVLEAAAD